MITNKRTKILKEIRRQIRHAIKWYNSDNGTPTFWSSLNYKRAKRMKHKLLTKGEENYHYYTRSNRAIEQIAITLYESVVKSLSTFPKEKEHNSSSKKDCFTNNCLRNKNNKCEMLISPKECDEHTSSPS